MRVHKTDLTTVSVGASVTKEVFLVKKANVRKGGRNPYYDLEVANKFGDQKLKVWDPYVPIKEGSYVELSLVGLEHSTYGKQWKVKGYTPVNYEGDEEFPEVEEKREIDVGKLVLELTETQFTNSTCKSLYTQYLDIVVKGDRVFKSIPYSRDVGFYKHGLLHLTYELVHSSLIGIDLWGLNEDLVKIAAHFHSLGSLDFFDVRGKYMDRFIESEDSQFHTIEELSQEYISTFAKQAYVKGDPVDSLTVKTIRTVCKEMVTDGPFKTTESAFLSGILRTLVLRDKYEKVRKSSGSPMFFNSGDAQFINVRKVFK